MSAPHFLELLDAALVDLAAGAPDFDGSPLGNLAAIIDGVEFGDDFVSVFTPDGTCHQITVTTTSKEVAL
jgi:hypothetical protein